MPSFDSMTSWSWILGISGRVQGSRERGQKREGHGKTKPLRKSEYWRVKPVPRAESRLTLYRIRGAGGGRGTWRKGVHISGVVSGRFLSLWQVSSPYELHTFSEHSSVSHPIHPVGKGKRRNHRPRVGGKAGTDILLNGKQGMGRGGVVLEGLEAVAEDVHGAGVEWKSAVA